MKIAISVYLIIQLSNFCNAQKNSPEQDWVGNTKVEKVSDNFLWFSEGYEKYIPDSSNVNQLKKILPGYNFLVFAGTWCGDTKKLLPAFYRVADLAEVSHDKIELYLLNHDKKSPRHLERQYKVKAVPVIIVFKEGKEIGRIIETTEVSIEADLLKIVKYK
jgi:thiol-disulfide isomerase/thioredoxin